MSNLEKRQNLKILLVPLIFILFFGIGGSTTVEVPFLSFQNDAWVNSTLKSLTTEEKIGQLTMITAYPDQGEGHKKQLIKHIKEFKPGGVLIMQGSPYETARLINDLQEASNVPLLIAIDGETGLGFRLDSTISYPQAQTLGAINDISLIYDMGVDIGKQFKKMGIHINFAPVADINTNPLNPVINFRSFGEDKKNVADKALAFSVGMQEAGILAVAKHFPGHGDTQTDSHKTLPVLNKTREEIDSFEVYPFKHLIINGIGGIMTGHLNVSAFDQSNIPASLSPNVIQKYLRETLGFNGLVVTDAMNMKGVTQPSGKAELEALKAGNDMVEFVSDIAKTLTAIKSGIQSREISEKDIDSKCLKILAIKRWVELNNYRPADLNNLVQNLNNPIYEVTQRKLIENSLTVLVNNNTLPIDGLDTLKIASVNIGRDSISDFQKMLGNYTLVDNFTIPKDATPNELAKLKIDLKPYNLVIGGIFEINLFPFRKFGVANSQVEAVKQIISAKKSVFVFFGNAYALKYFDGMENADGLVMAYEDSKLAQELSAQLIFGAFDASGKLPVTINENFKEGSGLPLKNIGRFKYTIPEEVGINSAILNQRVDALATLGIDSMAYPGCQILIAKDCKIIFHKCYGFFTYKKETPVTTDNLYDWASITKITGPLPALMKLNAEGKFNLDKPLSKYWPDWIGSNKEHILIRDILTHQARLKAWLPFWQETLKKNGKLKSTIFKNHPTNEFTFRVSSNLYMNQKYQKTMFEKIRESPLLTKKKYVYSDLGFHLFPTVIENITKTDYETYIKENFYKPLGAYTITYNPYKYFPIERMVPTEFDDSFRKELIQGFVHDESAAMMGGISGNAGLFGTVNDLAKLMQMYMQKGNYGGKQYIPEKTVNEFIRCQFPKNENRRALGFDKPYIDNYKNKLSDAYPAIDASKNSFGHTGFTGTFTWPDPDNNLLLIFFTNRVYPTRENIKLTNLNLRTAIHQAIYDCIKEGL